MNNLVRSTVWLLFFLISLTAFGQIQNAEIDAYLKAVKNKELRAKLTNFFSKNIQIQPETNGVTTLQIADSALRYLPFDRYCRAGSKGYGKTCLDCSGFVKTAYANNGIKLPGGSQNQATYGTLILDKKQLKRGDLLYFTNTYKAGKGIFITHTGIVLNDSTWIHSASHGGVVLQNFEAEYYFKKGRYLFATRIITDEIMVIPPLESELFEEFGIEIERQ